MEVLKRDETDENEIEKEARSSKYDNKMKQRKIQKQKMKEQKIKTNKREGQQQKKKDIRMKEFIKDKVRDMKGEKEGLRAWTVACIFQYPP